MRIILVAISFYMIWGHSARAAQPTTQRLLKSVQSTPINTSKAKANKAASKSNKFAVGLDLSIGSNLEDQNSSGYASSTTLALSTAYKFTQNLAAALNTGAEKQNYGEETFDFINSAVSMTYSGIKPTNNITVPFGILGILPTNTADREDNTYRGGVGARAGITNSYTVLGRNGNASYGFSYLQNVHEYERNINNEANLQHRNRHELTIRQDLTKNLSVEVFGRYQFGYTYQNALRTRFFLSQELQYDINKTTQIYVQHANTDSALEANGTSSNVAIYDEYSSVVTTGVRANF